MSWLILILRILLYFLLFIITSIVLVLVFPLTLSLSTEVDGFDYEGKFRFSIVLGLISGTLYFNAEENTFGLRLASLPIYRTSLEETEKKPEKEEEPKEPSPRGDFRSSINLLEPLIKLLRSIINRIKIRRFDLNLKAGLSDPYTSGMVFGITFPIIEMMKLRFPIASISITPIFIEETFYAFVESVISMRLILFVLPVIRFLISKEFRAYRKSRRK